MAMSPEDRAAEDQDMLILEQTWQALLESMDPMQKQIILSQLNNMLPSGQIAFKRKVVSDGGESILPPS